LKKYDPALKFAVTLTEERALAQAKQADAEIAAENTAGRSTACRGAPRTCWHEGHSNDNGAQADSKARMIEEDATVVKRLDKRAACWWRN